MTGKNDGIADRDLGCGTDRQGRGVQPAKGLHKAETRFVVVSGHVARNGHARMVHQPDGFRLDDQVADSQDQSIFVDHYAMAGSFRTKDTRSVGAVRHPRLQRDDAVQGVFQIKIIGGRIRQ